MNLLLTDSRNRHLRITSEVDEVRFDALACSAHDDGFTVLNSLHLIGMSRDAIRAACDEVIECRKVRLLAGEAAGGLKVLIMPVVKAQAVEGRLEAARLMDELFTASQENGVGVKALRITQFAHVRRYPRAHILGVLDGLAEIAAKSFMRLETIGLELRKEHEALLREDARQVLGG